MLNNVCEVLIIVSLKCKLEIKVGAPLVLFIALRKFYVVKRWFRFLCNYHLSAELFNILSERYSRIQSNTQYYFF